MGQLEDEIARVAALRGRKPEDVAALQEQQAYVARRVAYADIEAILKAPSADPWGDMLAQDALPQRLREYFIDVHAHQAKAPLNATEALKLLAQGKSVDAIIGAMQQRLSATARRP